MSGRRPAARRRPIARAERAVAQAGLTGVALAGTSLALAARRRRRHHAFLAETDPLGPAGCRLPEGRALVVPTPDGAHLAVTVAGPEDGPTVVLAHCWTGSRATWAAVARRLVLGGHRVVLYDQRGHGQSASCDVPPSIPQLGHDLRAVIEATDARDALLVGHSMGGMTIKSYAQEHHAHFHEHARGVVLVATAAHTLGVDVPARVIHALLGEGRLDWTRRGALGRRMVRGSLGQHVRRTHLEHTLEHFAATHGAARAGYLVAMASMDLRGVLETIDVPATVLVGTRDRLTPPRLARVLAERLPDARLLVLPGAGHMLPLEAPDRVIDAIKATEARADARRTPPGRGPRVAGAGGDLRAAT